MRSIRSVAVRICGSTSLTPPKPGRGRVHIDVSVPREIAVARVEAAVAAGGRVVDSHDAEWWTLASPDNHGVDLAAWPDDYDEDNDGD